MWICPAVYEILANKAFIVTNGLISWLFVVAFIHPVYIQIAIVATVYYNDKWPHKAVNLLISDLEWEVHKRTRQEVSTKLESYIYKVHIVYATNNYVCPYVHATISCPPYFLLKATMLYTCCHDLKLKGLSNKTTLILSNTRELDRVPSTK